MADLPHSVRQSFQVCVWGSKQLWHCLCGQQYQNWTGEVRLAPEADEQNVLTELCVPSRLSVTHSDLQCRWNSLAGEAHRKVSITSSI